MLLLLLYYGGLLLLSCRRTAEVSKETAATSNESRAVPKHSSAAERSGAMQAVAYVGSLRAVLLHSVRPLFLCRPRTLPVVRFACFAALELCLRWWYGGASKESETETSLKPRTATRTAHCSVQPNGGAACAATQRVAAVHGSGAATFLSFHLLAPQLVL